MATRAALPGYTSGGPCFSSSDGSGSQIQTSQKKIPDDMPKQLSTSSQKVVKKCPKSDQKVPKKLSKNSLSKIWGAKNCPTSCKKRCQKLMLWQIEVAAFGRHPKRGAAAFGRCAPFWFSICQRPKQNWSFYGPRFCGGPLLTTF